MTSIIHYAELVQSWPSFSKKIQSFMDELGFTALKLNCDHAAIRINHLDIAEQLKNHAHEYGQIISENNINGRPILIIQLNQALIIGDVNVHYLELPFPNDKHYPVEGWEHIELVFPSTAPDCQTLSDELQQALPALAPIMAGQSDIKIKMSSPKGDKERLANPTLAFKKDHICIKIHPHHIKDIIASEAAKPE
ncbi:VOC family protein [Shewanella surugensis]|uniref:VOC family protein n=1 Tax=Shewanella surugensis TaxID=212020 RepID=A0ABT0L9E3_9GAMM|nr:VOC family protein [Shewanella surugensis]MCL1124337.1 VOC family protein [Shewanella surugensis]